MHHRLRQQIVEAPVIAALGGGIVDLKQRFGFGPADRLMLDRGRGQDPRAPGGVMGIQRARKMHPAPVVGPSPVMTPSRTMVSACGSGIPAGNLGGLDGADWLGDVTLAIGADMGTLFIFLFWASIFMRA